MTEGELGEVALQIVITSDCTIRSHDEEILVVRPTQAFNGALVPIYASNQLSCTAVQIDT